MWVMLRTGEGTKLAEKQSLYIVSRLSLIRSSRNGKIRLSFSQSSHLFALLPHLSCEGRLSRPSRPACSRSRWAWGRLMLRRSAGGSPARAGWPAAARPFLCWRCGAAASVSPPASHWSSSHVTTHAGSFLADTQDTWISSVPCASSLID